MDGEQPGPSGWQVSEGQFPATQVFVTSSAADQQFSQAAQSFAASQLTESQQYQALAHAEAFVYQEDPNAANFERISPVEEYPTSASSAQLQQLQTLSADGSQIIQVAQVHPHLVQIPLSQLRHHAESTTNEATPLVSADGRHSLTLALQSVANSTKVEGYDAEPDTTQDDPQTTYVTVHREGYQQVGGSLDVQNPDTPAIDSTVEDAALVSQHVHLDHINSSINSGVITNSVINSSVINSSVINSNVVSSNAIDTSSMGQHHGEQSFDSMLVTAGPSGFHLEHHGDLEVGQGQLTHMEQAAEYMYQSENEDTQSPVEGRFRKSERLANMEGSGSPTPMVQYQSKGYYNPDELWCDDCKASYLNGCPKHRLQEVYDKVVFSRAWASLPGQLQIFRLGESTDLGVFAKRSIPKRSQFGPFISEIVENRELVTNKNFTLQVDREEHVYFYEAVDENKCNWMMFVRPAQNYEEQNLVAYQYGSDIYFCTTKHIQPRTELKVWYSAQYAERLGFPVYEPPPPPQPELKWECYECEKKFKSSALLQKHMSEHDDYVPSGEEDTESSDAGGRRSSRRRTAGRRKPEEQEGEVDEGEQEIQEDGDEEGQNGWKKKKTSIYLSKYKKYHRDTIKKSIKSLYKRKGKETGGQEWVCTHCDLTFDNSSLLNLHTLTHAAEDIGMDEIQRLTNDSQLIMNNANGLQIISSLDNSVNQQQQDPSLSNYVSLSDVQQLSCPVCQSQFSSKQELIQHAGSHARSKRGSLTKPYKCNKCWKSFSQLDRLSRHMLCHGAEENKPLQCNRCQKRFMNNSALACHLKTHSDSQYYDCIVCGQGFDQVAALKKHVLTHADSSGTFHCTFCHRTFKEYSAIRKHIRAFHSEKKFPCNECDKAFSRLDKLRLHQLRHSSIREFMCDTCGRQFKRKDKLREHMKRMHTPGREKINRQPKEKKFIPKVSPSDYTRFIYKCHTCLLGFKRRGMLVNHLAKKHPDTKPEQVPELNLPILKTQRDYFCQYCDKVYKSSSKRKAHIMKNHPGAEVPPNIRGKDSVDNPGSFMTTYCQMVGSVTTVPQPCQFCHKQYASKAKLLQHQRKKHSALVPPVSDRRRPQAVLAPSTTITIERRQAQPPLSNNTTLTLDQASLPANTTITIDVSQLTCPICQTSFNNKHELIQHTQEHIDGSKTGTIIITPMMQQVAQASSDKDAECLVEADTSGNTDTLPGADLLTQAMSELTSMTEYRVSTPGSSSNQLDYLGQRVMQAQVSAGGGIIQSQASTIELSQLGLVHTQFSGNQAVSQAVLNPQTLIVTSSAAQTTVPISQAQLITRNWNSQPSYQTFR